MPDVNLDEPLRWWQGWRWTSGPMQGIYARAGVTVALKVTSADNSGTWLRGADELPYKDGTTRIEVVMDRRRKNAGEYTFRNQTGQTSDPVRIRKVGPHVLAPRISVPTVLTLAYLAVLNGLYFKRGYEWNWSNTPTGLAFASGIFVVSATVLVAMTVGKTGAIRELFTGADQRYSNSKTQMMLWTILVAIALAFLAGIALKTGGGFLCSDKDKNNCIDPGAWPQYLLLLGVPMGASVISSGITSSKVAAGSLQKTESTSGPSLTDLPANDAGKADIVDVQYLIFNLIAIVFVAVSFLRTGYLGKVPDLLLALTSTSAGTYVLNKSLQNNRPSIGAVIPSVISPGTEVEIRGQNLFPPGSDDDSRPHAVKIAGVDATGSMKPDRANNRITVRAPLGLTAGDAKVTVVTSANVETDEYPVKIAEFHIGNFDRDPAVPGKELGIFLDGIPQRWTTVVVDLGSRRITDATSAGNKITMTVPDDLQGDSTQVVVRVDGRATPPRQLTLSR